MKQILSPEYQLKISCKVQDKMFLPTQGSKYSAGYDLRSAEDRKIFPGQTVSVSAGISIALPLGFYGAVCSRSGLAFNHRVCVPNDPGIIDSDYRGEIHVLLFNFGKDHVAIKRGDRIAQLIIQKHADVKFTVANVLPDSERGENGLGSTGL